MQTEIRGMHPGGKNPDPAGGKYELVKNVTDKALWAHRTEEFGEKLVAWDLGFEFMEHPEMKNKTEKGCFLHAMSRLQNDTRHGDGGSDFCNLFNVFKGSGKKFSEIRAPDCKEMPPKEMWDKRCTKVAEEETLEITPEQTAEFVSGIIEGLIGKNDLPEIQKCLKDSGNLDQDIEEAISDFSKGDVPDIIKGVEAVGRIIQELPVDL
jgi:hypothetical protein